MKQRKHPFGYAIQNGAIAVDPDEAPQVCWIFETYASGLSYQELANSLAAKGIAYCGEMGGWNKNVIARILQNSKYLGDGRYPAILEEAQFQSAQDQIKKQVRPLREGADIKAIRSRAVCAACGNPLKRNTKNAGRERWCCDHCGAISPKVSDKCLKDGVIRCLDLDSDQPLPLPKVDCSTADIEEVRLKNEVNRGLEHPNGSEERIRVLILELAVKRYGLCADEDYLARRISHLAQQRKTTGQFDSSFFKDTVETVLVQADGAVSIRLKNGRQIHNNDFIVREEQQQ